MGDDCCKAGVSVAHAPHPERELIWIVWECGCRCLISAPLLSDVQAAIDAWFDARRDLPQDWRGSKA